MGNNSSSFTLCKACFVISSCAKLRDHKAIQVVKRDGKVMTFTNSKSPIFVKDVMAKLSEDDFKFGVGLSKEANSSSENLPLDYELKNGKLYYVTTINNNNIKKDINIDHECEPISTGVNNNNKRVKIVITRQQLKEILAKQISVEQILLLELEKKNNKKIIFSSVANKSTLESIPEEIEY